MNWQPTQKRRKSQSTPTAYRMTVSNYYVPERPNNNRKVTYAIIIIGVIIMGAFARIVFSNIQHSVNAEQPNIFGIKISTEKSRAAEAKAAVLAKSNQDLNILLQNFAQPYGAKVSAIIIDTSTGGSASVNADKPTVSASLYKLFVAYGIYKKIDSGSLSLKQSLAKYGMSSSVNQCLDLMITVSDNDCGIALGKLLGWKSLDSMLISEGYGETILNNYLANGNLNGKDKTTSVQDVAKLLKLLNNGELLKPETTKHFTDLLKAQEVNKYLPTGLPKNTVLAHKTGDLYGYIHDAGILYSGNKNIIVVLMTGEWITPAKDAPPVFAKFSKAVLAYSQQTATQTN